MNVYLRLWLNLRPVTNNSLRGRLVFNEQIYKNCISTLHVFLNLNKLRWVHLRQNMLGNCQETQHCRVTVISQQSAVNWVVFGAILSKQGTMKGITKVRHHLGIMNVCNSCEDISVMDLHQTMKHMIPVVRTTGVFVPTWTRWGCRSPRLHRGRAGPQTAAPPCCDTEASTLLRPAEPSAPSRCPDLRTPWRDWLRAPLAVEEQREDRVGFLCDCMARTIARWLREWRLYITLAGLIPVPPPLAVCFWIWCSWQILSLSSLAVSSAAAYTTSPLLRPFTSAALMAATSRAPHALRTNTATVTMREKKVDLFWKAGFHLDRINSVQEFSQYLPTWITLS